MKTLSGEEFMKILEKEGWELKRVKGSHHVFMKPGVQVRISLPVHGNKPLKIGLLRHFMKLAGISEQDL